MAEQGDEGQPQWARHQVVAGYVVGALGIALFIAEALDEPVWGVTLDFGAIKYALGMVGGYVVFHIKLSEWFQRGRGGG